jgi:hypothetical protein
MGTERKRDWQKFWIHLVCGACLGALLGFGAWAHSSYGESVSARPAVIFIGGGALLFALVAGFSSFEGDAFWHDWHLWS